MSRLCLQVASVGYLGPAGTSGAKYDAEMSGAETDKVYYRIATAGLTGTLSDRLAGGNVQTAYLVEPERVALDAVNVQYSAEADVRTAGHGTYLLWRVDPKTKTYG